MDSKLKVNMFVAVCKLEELMNIRLNDIAEELLTMPESMRKLDRFTLTKIVPKVKGQLHRKCGLKDNMGSVSLSVKYVYKGQTSNYNLLLFKSSVRIAGGVHSELQEEIHEAVSEKPIEEFCGLLMFALYHWSAQIIKINGEAKIVNMNAINRGAPIPQFATLCEQKLYQNPKYHTVYVPHFFERGPIATCHVYPLQGQKCSAKIQYTGVVQYMGFKEIDMLHVFSEMLNKDINSK